MRRNQAASDNVWHSTGAGRRDDDRAGLAFVRVDATPAAGDALAARLDAAGIARSPDSGEFRDPRGTRIEITRG